MSEHLLDLRGVVCPMNFVKTKLFIDKLKSGDTVCVLLDRGEPVESVSSSIEAEGHKIILNIEQPEGHFALTIGKV